MRARQFRERFSLVYDVDTVFMYSFMADTAVISVRLPAEKVRRIEREAHRSGRKVSQVAAEYIEGGFRRRDFPCVELRDTAAGRVAYLKGTHLAVHWVANRIRAGEPIDAFALACQLPVDRLRGAMAYAAAFPEEMSAAVPRIGPGLSNRMRRGGWESVQGPRRSPSAAPTRGRDGERCLRHPASDNSVGLRSMVP
jgi:hypothetical protein